jgi:hypothetical protein
MTRRVRVAAVIVGVMTTGAAVCAHSGPPYPIVSNQIAGAYEVSLWTDPDTTDDGSAAGKFWVMMNPARKGIVLAPDTRVNEGPLGPADVEAAVDATYDLRPRPIVLALALMPFLLVGFLWVKLLLRRRKRT